jgi:DNA-binding MarR family transcriptional regulator
MTRSAKTRSTNRPGTTPTAAGRGGVPARSTLLLIPQLHRATHRVGLWLDRHAALGVTQAESHILAHLVEAGPSTVGQLHRALEHRRSTLTSVLDRLEGRGLVGRTVAPRDRRSFVVQLTHEGERLAIRTHGALAALERGALRHLKRNELEALTAALDRIGHPEVPLASGARFRAGG